VIGRAARHLPKLALALACAGALAAASPAHAGFDEGMAFYNKGDYFRALSELKPEAEAGNPLAQVQVAGIYQYGLVGAANYAEAIKWYKKAAAVGNADALLGLGVMYNLGQGVPQDKVESVKWLTLAADRLPQGPDRNRVLTALDTMKEQMSDEELARARKLVADWKPGQP
jgi:TPR repeat protein